MLSLSLILSIRNFQMLPPLQAIPKVELMRQDPNPSSGKETVDLPHPTPINPSIAPFSIGSLQNSALAANFFASTYGASTNPSHLNALWAQNQSLLASPIPTVDGLMSYPSSVSLPPYSLDVSQFRQQMFPHVKLEDRDSGNETASSPSNTPLTGSPHSLPSR